MNQLNKSDQKSQPYLQSSPSKPQQLASQPQDPMRASKPNQQFVPSRQPIQMNNSFQQNPPIRSPSMNVQPQQSSNISPNKPPTSPMTPQKQTASIRSSQQLQGQQSLTNQQPQFNNTTQQPNQMRSSQSNQPQRKSQSQVKFTYPTQERTEPQKQIVDQGKQNVFDQYQNQVNMSFQGEQNNQGGPQQQKNVNFMIPDLNSSESGNIKSQQAKNMFQSDVRIPSRAGVSPLKGPTLQSSSIPDPLTQSKVLGSNEKVVINLSQMVNNNQQGSQSKIFNKDQPLQSSFTKDFKVKEDDKLKDVFQEFNRMASLKPIPVGEMNQGEVLPKSFLPNFLGDSHDYNILYANSMNVTIPNLSLENRHRSFDIDKFLNQPQIQLITMQKLYKIDLFKQTKLHKQLLELEEQGIKLSKKQQQLVQREQHIYGILSKRRMEYLEYVDFLVPYMLLFNQHIKKEIQDLRAKSPNQVYRPLLVKTRADQEQYFLQRGGYDKWNFENLSGKQQSTIFEGSTIGLMIFASKEVALQNPLDKDDPKLQLVNPNQGSSFVHKLKTTQQGVVEKHTLLYGFKLYIFSDQTQQNPENEIRLPVRYLSNQKKPEYTLTLKSDDDKQQIEIVSDADLKILDWYQEFIRQTTLKQYYFICGRACLCPQRHIVEAIKFGTTSYVKLRSKKIDYRIVDLNEGDLMDLDPLQEPKNQMFREVVVSFLTNFFQLIRFKTSLKILDLSGQRLSSFFLVILFDEIDLSEGKLRLQTLILDQNYVNKNVIDKLSIYLTNQNSSSLEILSLNLIELKDDGIETISQGLIKRHNFLRSTKYQDHLLNMKNINQGQDLEESNKKRNKQPSQDIYFINYQIPLLDLRLRNTRITDQGLFHLCQAFEKVNEINLKNNGGDPDYQQHMSLDISFNDITENSLRYLGGLLTKFNAIKYLNISGCYRMMAVYSEYFFECLNQNYSLQVLDLSQIKLSQKFLDAMLKMLSNNCTIMEVKIQIDEILGEYLANYSDKALIRLLQLKISKPSEYDLFYN